MPALRSNRNRFLSTLHGTIDTRWKAVDDYTLPHSHPTTRPNTKALQNCLSNSLKSGLPDYGVSAAQGKFLALHCKTANVTNVLEIGTLGGYSAIWMASENPRLKVTTIEYSKHHAAVARENIRQAGLEERVEVFNAPALRALPKLQQQVRSGTRERFGFVFIDADKANNWSYFQSALSMIRKNGVICVDNIVREGALADLEDEDPYVVASREVVGKVGELEGVDSVVMQTVGEKSYDGFLWAVVE